MPDTSEKHARYARAMEKVFTDPEVLIGLDEDAEGTLERLGFDLTPEARKQLARGKVQVEPGTSAFVAVVVRVATSPAVRVVVSSSTFATGREPSIKARTKKGGGTSRK